MLRMFACLNICHAFGVARSPNMALESSGLRYMHPHLVPT